MEVLKFSQTFLNENPYQRSVEDNWSIFKEAMHDIINRNILNKIIKSHKDLPWLNYSIKCKMKRSCVQATEGTAEEQLLLMLPPC